MWVALLYPPFVLPLLAKPPATCPKCGAQHSLRIHEYSRRKPAPPTTTLLTSPQATLLPEAKLLNPYSAPRVYCTSCERTTTLLDSQSPHLYRGLRIQNHTAAIIVTWYCRGRSVPFITGVLKSVNLEVKRSTLYRVLKSVGSDDLSTLHRINSRRFLRSRPRESFAFLHNGTSLSDHTYDLPDYISEDVSNQSDGIVYWGVKWRAEVFFLYADDIGMRTIEFIGDFFKSFGHSQVIVSKSLDRLIDGIGLRPLLHQQVSVDGDCLWLDSKTIINQFSLESLSAIPQINELIIALSASSQENETRMKSFYQGIKIDKNDGSGVVFGEISADDLFYDT